MRSKDYMIEVGQTNTGKIIEIPDFVLASLIVLVCFLLVKVMLKK